ncbi:MAG: hypothetical protein R3195_18515 [Gemmatimonadota bacterium]|nr:hypothetical protein [Gemmatimonadota bacterium]
MADLNRLVREVHRRSLWQVLVVYVGSGWLVLQFVDTLADALNLPDWATPLAFFLLVVGLPVVLATAFVQAPRSPDADARAGSPDASPGSTDTPDEGGGPDALAGLRARLTWPRALLAGAVAFSLLFGVAGLFVILGDDDASAPPADSTVVADPAVAVLPFTVRGLDPETWNDGMAVLLPTTVESAPGVRAIPSRTVSARWSTSVGESETDLDSALGVARELEARFALLGSAVASGSTTRVDLELYDSYSGERLDRASLDDASRDLLDFTDWAATATARMVLEAQGMIPDVEHEPLTDAPEAELAFLEGEVAFRDYRLLEAREAYGRAVEIDTAFAFAHLRLAEVAQWGATVSMPLAAEHRDAASRHIDRLTERSAVRVRAYRAAGAEALSILREAVARFPDDAILWYELGEELIHGSAGFPGLEEIETAFRRSLDLDPGRGATYPHVIHLAFMESADTAEARRLVDRFAEIASDVEGPYTADADPRIGPYGFDLVFGSTAQRAAAWAAVDTAPPTFLLALTRYVFSPRHWEVYERVSLAAARHPGAASAPGYFGAVRGTANRQLVIGYGLWRGQPARGLEFAEGEQMAFGPASSESRALLYFLHALDVPIPDDVLDEEFGSATIDSASHPQTVFAAGALAVDRGRWQEYEEVLAELRRRGSEDARIEILEAYAGWGRGDVESAIPVFERFHPGNRLIQWWLGDAYIDAGRFDDAERVFASYAWNQWFEPFSREPLAQLRLGLIYEELGRPDDAIAAYGYFVEQWEDAEPALQPIVDDARARLGELLAARG